mgnify:CR=1 FL=1
MRIVLSVEEVEAGDLVVFVDVLKQFVGFGYESVVFGYAVGVELVEGLPTVPVALFGGESPKAEPLHGCGDGGACHVEYGFRVVDVVNEGVVDGSSGNLFRVANDKRHAHGGIQAESLVEKAMFADVHALVGCVDDDGVFELSAFFEIGSDTAYVFVDSFDAAQVVLGVFLVGGFGFLDIAKPIDGDFPGRPVGRGTFLAGTEPEGEAHFAIGFMDTRLSGG